MAGKLKGNNWGGQSHPHSTFNGDCADPSATGAEAAAVSVAQTELFSDSKLLYPAIHDHTRVSLLRIVTLLLACRTNLDRVIVGLRLFHRLKINEVADELNLPLGQVRDLYESICIRARKAEITHKSEVALARFNRAER